MIRRILVPVDGTPFGEYAIPYAVALATRACATIELVHVHVPVLPEPGPAISPFAARAPDYGWIGGQHALDRAAEWLEVRARALHATTGLEVVARTVRGRPGEALCEEIAALRADLVVMATHARGGLKRARLGSIADLVVRHAAAPVLLVHPPDETASPPLQPTFRRILIPLDGSRFSEQILPHARELSRLTGAQPLLLHVVVPFPPASRRGSLRDAETVEEQRRCGTEYLGDIARGLMARTGPVATLTCIDRRTPVAILEVANDPAIDVIALATHGRGGASRLLFGSTSDEVVRHTTKPVLLYRPHAADLLRDVFSVYGEQTATGEAPAEISLR